MSAMIQTAMLHRGTAILTTCYTNVRNDTDCNVAERYAILTTCYTNVRNETDCNVGER